MGKSLVIVESPAKAKTINKYLGKEFDVEASIGHIKDLPKKTMGVDIEGGTFEPELIVSEDKLKLVAMLKKLAAKADKVYLAPDPDREGEAIAYHLEQELQDVAKAGAIQRVTFNEITPKAVKAAFEHGRPVDRNLVDAQQTRRVLDRLVGYEISPLLWDKVRRGLSAGRVQTVAVRLIVEREREIKAFNPVEYWTIDASLHPAPQGLDFTARFIGIDGKKSEVPTVGAPALPDGVTAKTVVAQLEKAKWQVRSVEKKERRKSPAAPFTTSKLQQDASRQLGFNVKRTMGVAQRLYEGLEIGSKGTVGLITYMRTDSTRVSPEALNDVRAYVEKKIGKNYLPAQPNAYKSKKDAQDAHEAIRPTDVTLHPDEIHGFLSEEQYKLYRLIWQRFVASQMVQAVYDQTTVDIEAKADRSYDFRVSGSVLKFDGFLKVYEEAKDKKDDEDESLENKLPELNEGQALVLNSVKADEHYTEPPPRYNEASLVKELEEDGIGRPSTYASIINTIQDREYVVKLPPTGRSGRFYPTEIGMVVTDLLVKSFPYIFDTQYTAKLEEELDSVEDGTEKGTRPADRLLRSSKQGARTRWREDGRRQADGEADRRGLRSLRLASGAQVGQVRFVLCLQRLRQEERGKLHLYQGELRRQARPQYARGAGRRGKRGVLRGLRTGDGAQARALWHVHGLPGYNEDPPCKTTRKLDQKVQQKPPVPLEEECPKCGKQLVLRNGQYGEFVSCSGYPKCKYIKQNFIGVKCPQCGDGELIEKKARRGNLFYGCSNYPKCDFTSNNKPVDQKCPECGSAYLLEKTLKSGVYLVCPNNKKTTAEEEAPKKRGKKAAESAASVACSFIKRIADPPPPVPIPPMPTAATHAPLVEQPVG